MIIISFINFIRLFINKFEDAKYLILFKNNKLIDPRCTDYWSPNKKKNTLYICRCLDSLSAIKFFFKYKNVIYINAVEYFYKKNTSEFFMKVFQVSNIKKFTMIDDYRYIKFFTKICKTLNIFIEGYMHARISRALRYQKSLFNYKFDRYYLWSNYYKKKILENNNLYNSKDLVIKRPYFLKQYLKLRIKKNKKKNVLMYIEEDNIPFFYFKTLYFELSKDKFFKLVFKFRPNKQRDIKKEKFLKFHKIKIYHRQNLIDIIQKENVNMIIGTNTTLLILAPLMKIFPLAFDNKFLLSDYRKDNIVFLLKNLKSISIKIKKILSNKKKLNLILNKVWN